jgi:hypothetical protein
MVVKIMIHTAFLCCFSFAHCMELTNPQKNTSISHATLSLNSFLIREFIKISKKNTSNPLLLVHRTKRLNLLQQLLDNNAEITFSNEDNDIKFWLNKDKNIVTQILHEKFLSFLSYQTNKNTIKINHTLFFDQQKPFNCTMQYHTFLLHITSAQPLPYNTKQTLKRFLHEYERNNVQQQRNNQHLVPNKSTTNAGDKSIELTEDDYDLFRTLPYNTQELLRDILFDRDGLIQ